AARLLLGGTTSDAVQIVLPKGQQVLMRLEFCRAWENGAEAGTLKDAGDDPDVTHGAARLLLGGTTSDAVQIVLPKGQQVLMRLEFCRA
ncbi:cobalt-precorrin-5B (C(1))-methyltransferase, partial [Pseudomonas aeruginosa]